MLGFRALASPPARSRLPQIGIGAVIKGWDEGVMGMSLGEKAVLNVSSDFGVELNSSDKLAERTCPGKWRWSRASAAPTVAPAKDRRLNLEEITHAILLAAVRGQ